MHPALKLLPVVLLLAGCKQPSVQVKTESNPSPAVLTLNGRELGRTPMVLQLDQATDIPRIRAAFQGQELVEQRIRFLPDGRAELIFLFGEDRSVMAKALGLARVLVFEYGAGLTFDVNKADLKSSSLPLLERQADMLNTAFKDVPVHVCGHTDSSGTQEQNLELSLLRAKAVLTFLASHGVAKERLRPQGFAAAYPLATNQTEDGRALNRRTEVVLGM